MYKKSDRKFIGFAVIVTSFIQNAYALTSTDISKKDKFNANVCALASNSNVIDVELLSNVMSPLNVKNKNDQVVSFYGLTSEESKIDAQIYKIQKFNDDQITNSTPQKVVDRHFNSVGATPYFSCLKNEISSIHTSVVENKVLSGAW